MEKCSEICMLGTYFEFYLCFSIPIFIFTWFCVIWMQVHRIQDQDESKDHTNWKTILIFTRNKD